MHHKALPRLQLLIHKTHTYFFFHIVFFKKRLFRPYKNQITKPIQLFGFVSYHLISMKFDLCA
uniref:Uncharacterized protein n=1 Tax=Lepeophtheirus salmonis TaxID=72036 RepID=A0A0K2UK65_LEPSM